VGTLAEEEATYAWEIFRRAYKYWYGKEGTNEQINRAFGSWLRSGHIPIYVRAYERKKK
jgi:hypothetical protein